ncbi:MAG: hypothetical protein J6K21_01190 [Bacilli bacterium]|nr:hypothetical protein [Bacilli bacterium]
MNSIIKQIDELLKENDYYIISGKLIELYYNIGEYIYKKNKNIYEIEDILRNNYGLLIGFTRRNLNNMLRFYKVYNNYDINKLKRIEWNLHLIIMKQENKDELINYCLKYNINKDNLNKIIKNGFDIKYTDREKQKNDTVTLEIISLNI